MSLFICMTIALLFWFVLEEDVNADSDSFGKIYIDGGYKEITKAVQESEDHFKHHIALPTQLPPVPFTHSIGDSLT